MKNLPLYRQCVVSAGTICSMLGQGCIFAYSSVLISSFRKADSAIKVTPYEEGWIASINGIGFLFGIPMMIVIMDKFGRKISKTLSAIAFLSGWFLLALAGNVTVILIARFVQGLAVGLFIPIMNVIVGETTAPKYRGVFLVVHSLSFIVGSMVIQFIGIVLSWQLTAVAAAFLHFISLLVFIEGPESPCWLVSKSRYDEAREVFVYLRGADDESYAEINQLIDAQKSLRISEPVGTVKTVTWCSVLRSKTTYFFQSVIRYEFYRPWLIVVHGYILSQFSGVNVVVAYTSDVVETLLGADCDVRMWIVIMNIVRIGSNLGMVFIFKMFERKLILLVGSVVNIVSYIVMAGYMYGVDRQVISGGGWFPMLALCVYCGSGVACMSFSLVVGGEIFPLEYRALGGGTGSLVYSVMFFTAIKVFPTLSSSVGLPGTYVVYASVVLVNLVILMCITPETKDKTLQDIEDILRRGNKPNQVELQCLENQTSEKS